MRLFIASVLTSLVLAASAAPAFADATAPTNGGSANGGGASGQCTGDMDSRPPSCHNGHGAGN